MFVKFLSLFTENAFKRDIMKCIGDEKDNPLWKMFVSGGLMKLM